MVRGRALAMPARVVLGKMTYAGGARGARLAEPPVDERGVERFVVGGDVGRRLGAGAPAGAARHAVAGVGDALAGVAGPDGRGVAGMDGVVDPGQPRARVAPGGTATDRALARPAQVQDAFGAAERDVEQALLLVHRLRRLGVGDRHQALLEPGDEHGVELETLGPVEREQLDRVALALAGVVAAEGGLQELEEPVHAPTAAVGLEELVPQPYRARRRARGAPRRGSRRRSRNR